MCDSVKICKCVFRIQVYRRILDIRSIGVYVYRCVSVCKSDGEVCGSLWHSLVVCFSFWQSLVVLAVCDSLCQSLSVCGSLWHSLAFFGSPYVAVCGSLWQSVIACGSQW